MVPIGSLIPPTLTLFDAAPLRWRIHALLCLCLIVASQLMVTIRMDEFIDILWGYDFFVWYSFEAVLWIQIFPRMFQKTPPMPSWNIEENASAEENVEYEYLESMAARNKVRADKRKAMESFVWSLYRIHQLTMLGLKLDNYRNWNWWAVFWPTYVVSILLPWVRINLTPETFITSTMVTKLDDAYAVFVGVVRL